MAIVIFSTDFFSDLDAASVGSAVTALAAVVAVLVAVWQLRTAQEASQKQLEHSEQALRVERVIALHRDLTTGEVGQARDRLATLMWKAGEQVAGIGVCHAPTWPELRPEPLEGAPVGAGRFAVYPDEILGGENSEPMRDLYKILWFFERVEAGLRGGALDPTLVQDLLALHAVWWNELTSKITPDDTTHITSLRALASALETEKLLDWATDDFAPPAV